MYETKLNSLRKKVTEYDEKDKNENKKLKEKIRLEKERIGEDTDGNAPSDDGLPVKTDHVMFPDK